MAEEFGLAEAPTASLPNASRGMLLERQGDFEGAVAAYERAALLARRGGWPVDLAHALLLHAALKRRRRGHAGARELAREAGQALAGCADAGFLVERLARTERSLGARGETPQAGPDGELSEREIAVLRLLATDLSQREIGAELYVSFNTVKSHTRVVFRKLGVSRREDAVARGRELGLV
jgi:LuxR family maltose regulon positive regulatory protein